MAQRMVSKDTSVRTAQELLETQMVQLFVYIDEEDGETIGGSNHIIRIYSRDDKEKYPISFILGSCSVYGGNLAGHYHKIEHGLLRGYYAIDNVILDGTWITKLFPATKVWEDVYDFLSSQKDIEIIDTRTDKEKIISAGFDTKTSFRNIK